MAKRHRTRPHAKAAFLLGPPLVGTGVALLYGIPAGLVALGTAAVLVLLLVEVQPHAR